MTQSDYQNMALTARKIGVRMELRFNEALAQEKLTAPQALVVLYILAQGEQGSSLTDLSERSGYSKGTLSAVVKRLRQMGYLRCEPGMEDDRRKRLLATEKSRRAGPRLREALGRAEAQFYRGISREDLQTLERLQLQLLENLSQTAPDATKEGT